MLLFVYSKPMNSTMSSLCGMMRKHEKNMDYEKYEEVRIFFIPSGVNKSKEDLSEKKKTNEFEMQEDSTL